MAQRNRWGTEALVVLCLAGAYLLSFHPFDRPVVLDPATWDYMSLALRDGLVPYRDIFLHKTPGALFFGAAGAALARTIGVEPLYGVHAVFIFFGAAAPALVFYGCRRRGHSVTTALAAAAWLLAYDQWSLGAIEGARPKIATTALGLAALVAARARPLWGGALGAASVLCWQPGVVFLAAAAIARMRGVDGEVSLGDRLAQSLVPLAIGAALPVAALGAFLWSHGALDAFWRDAVLFNVHYVEINARTPLDALTRVAVLLKKWNALEMALFLPALAGVVLGDRRFPDGLAIAAMLYAALIFVSVQAWPDTILLGPGIAVTLAVGLMSIARRTVGSLDGIAILAVAIFAMATPRSERFFPPITLTKQQALYRELADELSATDEVFVVSAPEFLIHTRRHSVLPWPYMWFGVDRYAAASTEGGFDGLLAQLAQFDPKLMIVCRRWNGPLRKRFEAWAANRYTRETVAIYPHISRPMLVYRRKADDASL